MHSKKFQKVKDWYDSGMWIKKMVHDAIGKCWITPAEYEEITGKPYLI